MTDAPSYVCAINRSVPTPLSLSTLKIARKMVHLVQLHAIPVHLSFGLIFPVGKYLVQTARSSTPCLSFVSSARTLEVAVGEDSISFTIYQTVIKLLYRPCPRLFHFVYQVMCIQR